MFICLFGDEFGENVCMLGQVWEKSGDVANEAKERPSLSGRSGDRPGQDLVHLLCVSFDASCRDVMTEEVDLCAKQVS